MRFDINRALRRTAAIDIARTASTAAANVVMHFALVFG